VLGAGCLPLRCEPPEVRVQVSARCEDVEMAQAVEDEVYTLTICGPAGGGRVESITGVLPRDFVPTRIEWANA
jgi:hypothetical protein